ncbi:heavy-metal-associated domain-containing protein [Maribellus maritimus]|uniref:heavy-metal-associated domain-containing protein n=1 Tax=Maribellus maritimus TaxID=2870838 RepID=UPI001EEAE737|nr:hypothetical protein [Maribellus maritimus]MCG6191323.1 hypothetical protein [Maribellus maritimus]
MDKKSDGSKGESKSSVAKQKTVQIQVKMVCKGCCKYIERLILAIEGTVFAHCNYKYNLVEICFNPIKTNQNEIEKSISEGGYDTLNYKRKIEFYRDKPKCCEYRDELNKDDDFRA